MWRVREEGYPCKKKQKKNKKKKLFKRCYLFTFRERREAEREGIEISMYETHENQLPLTCPQLGPWPTTQARA